MPLSQADTRAKLIDTALHQRGWTEDLIKYRGLEVYKVIPAEEFS